MFGLFHLYVQVACSKVSYAGGAWQEGWEVETVNKPSLGHAKVAAYLGKELAHQQLDPGVVG